MYQKAQTMAKNFKTGKKSSFSQKKRNLAEFEELEESGMFDMLSNRQKIYARREEIEGWDHN